ncbi:MAG TPA: heliorhodopsin HeR [Thermomicrobiales bacterium]|nr:heliorhodopsin HeR [Thermomicrobiales bacterium]
MNLSSNAIGRPSHPIPAASIAQETVPERMRWYNLALGVIHLAQAVLIIALSNDFKLPIVGTYLTGPPGSEYSPPDLIWSVPVGYAVAVFLLLAAADHFLMAAPGIWPWYRDNLARQINYARWLEYSVSASLMMVLIAMVTGIRDVGAILAIFAANTAMILFGLVMEMRNHERGNRPVDWVPYICGCIVGIVPWIIVSIQVVGASDQPGSAGVPTFVYGIIISLFVLFNTFAINMILQYAKIGPWKNYLFGEKGYLVLSLTAKTLLAWQIFANTLTN